MSHITNIFIKGLKVQARYSGFSNLYTEGRNYSLSIYRYFADGHFLQLNYGNYLYDLKNFDSSRSTNWIRTINQIELPLKLYVYTSYEYHWGDDRQGHLIFTELGYRF